MNDAIHFLNFVTQTHSKSLTFALLNILRILIKNEIMEQRVSLMDAISLAGGMAKTADIKRVTILRGSASGLMQPMTVDLSLVMKGKLVAPYIEPGDQIIVPGDEG